MTIVSQTVTAGDPYSRIITAPNSLFFTSVDLPNGLTLGQNGVISGIPIQPGRFAITILVRGVGGTSAAVLDLTVVTPPTPFITSPDTMTHEMGTSFSYQITASSPTAILSYNATNLPTGLTVNTTTGLISGTPTSASNDPVETTTVVLSATNAAGTGSQNLILRLQQRPVITSSLTPLTFAENFPITPYTITATKSPLSFSAAPLPNGLNLNTESGTISGTPVISSPSGAAAIPVRTDVTSFQATDSIPSVTSQYRDTAFTVNPDGTVRYFRVSSYIANFGLRFYQITIRTANSSSDFVYNWGRPLSIATSSSQVFFSLERQIWDGTAAGFTYEYGVFIVGTVGNANLIPGLPTNVPFYSMAFDASNNLYLLSGQPSNMIIKRTPAGVYSSFNAASQTFVAGISSSGLGYGNVTSSGNAGGIFSFLTISPSGNIYVGVSPYSGSKGAILRISSSGTWQAIGIPPNASNLTKNTYIQDDVPISGIWANADETVYFTQGSSLYSLTSDDNANGRYTNRWLSGTSRPSEVSTMPFGGTLLFGDNSNNIYSSTGPALGSAQSGYISRVALNPQNSVTTTIAGSAGSSGFVNGTGSAARFSSPRGLKLSPSGVLYIADTGNGAIRKMTSSGVVTTLASGLTQPKYLAYAPSGNVYVTDTENNLVKKITPGGVVSTFVSSGLVNPTGITVDENENLYVADSFQIGTYAKITSTGTVSRISTNISRRIIDLAYDAMVINPSTGNSERRMWFLIQDTNAGLLYNWIYRGFDSTSSFPDLLVSDQSPCGSTTGSPYLSAQGYISDVQRVASSSASDSRARLGGDCSYFSISPDGSLYLTNSIYNSISQANLLQNYRLQIFANATGKTGSANGAGNAASFNNPTGIAAAIGFVYVADTNNHTIRKVGREVQPVVTNTSISATNNVYTSNPEVLNITVTG
jgi:sugar lactone lactonase YvrE